MKKILIALAAAVVCLCSSCTKEETDCIYTIQLTPTGSSESIWTPSESGTLIKEYEQAVTAFESKYTSDWQWKVTVKDEKYSKSDKAAKEKFQTYANEFSSLIKTWQAKFDACTDDQSSIAETFNLNLSRISTKDATIASETYSIKFNK